MCRVVNQKVEKVMGEGIGEQEMEELVTRDRQSTVNTWAYVGSDVISLFLSMTAVLAAIWKRKSNSYS